MSVPDEESAVLMMPMIRVSLESMKAQIIHAFHAEEPGFREGLREQIEAAFRTYDVETEVRRIALEVIREAVRRTVTDALADVFRTPEVKSAVDQHVQQALRAALRNL